MFFKFFGSKKMSPTKKMALTNEELSAIMKIAGQMVLADGKIDVNEDAILRIALNYFTAGSPDKTEGILKRSSVMSNTVAIELISNLDEKQKKFAFSFFATIMISDKDVTEEEITLLTFISLVCKLPSMKPEDAVCYFKESLND